MKKIILFLTTVMFCMFCIYPINSHATGTEIIANDETGIPDKGLYQAVLRVLEKSEDETFTKAEAENIIRIFDYNSDYEQKWYTDVKNLKGIGYLKNLKILRLQDHAVETLDGIEQLENLEILSVAGGKLKDIKPLEKCTTLKDLTLSSNKFSSLAGIENLTNLECLNISDNNLKSLKGIDKLKKLKVLNVSKNKLTKIEEVKVLQDLVDLDISQNKFTKINEIKELTKLEMLNVSYNQLKKLPALTKLENLTYSNLNITHNQLKEKEIRKKLPKKLLSGGGKAKKGWLKDQIYFQNLDYKLKLTTPGSMKKITTKTKKIVGKTLPNARVLLCKNEDMVESVKADKNGRFVMDNLKLTKLAGKANFVVFVKSKETGSWVEVQKDYIFKIKK